MLTNLDKGRRIFYNYVKYMIFLFGMNLAATAAYPIDMRCHQETVPVAVNIRMEVGMRKCAVLLLALVLGTLSPVLAADAPIEIKIGSVASEALPFVPALEKMAEYINQNSNGKYHATVYPSGKLGNASTEMQGLQTGMIHFYHDGSNNITPFVPVLGVFDLPYVFTNMDQVGRIFYGDFGEKLKKRASTKTLKCMGFANSTFRNICSTKPVKTLDDARKLKMRVTNSKMHTNAIKTMGISPTPMPFSELYTGMQQGVVDAFDLDYPYIVSSRLYEVAPYVFESNHMYTPQVLYTGQKWWDSLPDADRAMFTEAVNRWFAESRNLLEKDRERAKSVCVDAGNTITTPDSAELARWVEAVQPTRAMLNEKQKQLYSEIQEELKKPEK